MNLKETILVVDDEPSVLRLLVCVLKSQGFSILQADTVELVFNIGDTHDGIIDLLIADHFFLNTTGRRIAERILRTRPSMKVLYISGEDREVLIDEGSLSPADAFLRKPFLPNVLIAKVRELLDTNTAELNPRPWCLASVPYCS